MSDGSSPQVHVGQQVGHYMILSQLGGGGMGEVYLGYDTKLARQVAVKVLPARFAKDERRLKRFEVEAKALAALNHPNIVSVFSIEESKDQLFLVMELVEGKTLRELIQPAGMPVEQFIHVALSLADALAAAHDRGVMHRDLKPENIMVTPSGRVKILDFGLAKFNSGDEHHASAPTHIGTSLSVEGVAVGTIPYMSPEQAKGDAIDHRSDIFSLGLVFHEMLTGIQPFRGQTVAELVSAILRDNPPPVSEVRRDLPVDLDEILKRCLEKRRETRYSSADELHQSLKRLQRLIESDAPVTPGVQSSDPATKENEGIVAGVDSDSAWKWLDSWKGTTALFAGIWIVNWIETNSEELWSTRSGSWLGYDFARAFSWIEGGLSFERHDMAGPVAVYLGSVAYFFVPVLLLVFTLIALRPRRYKARLPRCGVQPFEGYRIFGFAITACYFVSLPFYLLTPIPERWAFPDSQAILLSDLWSARLIETIRPMSGIDNCFPSFHVSGTLALVFVWYLMRLRFRHAIAFLGGAVVISTLLLGIHWVADIVAGLALAMISMRIALRMNERVRTRLAA